MAVWNGNSRSPRREGFTLLELLVVIGMVGVLAALLLPALTSAKGRAKRATCLNNLHQITLATRMYAEDHQDAVVLPSGPVAAPTDYQLYKEYVKSYAGYKRQASPSEKLFACPSDSFYYSAGGGAGQYHSGGLCEQAFTDFTSYAFNGGNRSGPNYPALAGARLASVRLPARTLLILEAAAMTPFSWHQPRPASGDHRFPNSLNLVGYVDGHVSPVKMYCDLNSSAEAWQQEPPAGFDYQWSGD